MMIFTNVYSTVVLSNNRLTSILKLIMSSLKKHSLYFIVQILNHVHHKMLLKPVFIELNQFRQPIALGSQQFAVFVFIFDSIMIDFLDKGQRKSERERETTKKMVASSHITRFTVKNNR